MPVRYTPPTPESLMPVPGIALGTAAAKIKRWERDDLVLAIAEAGTVAAGVFTQNRFCAAPVTVCRVHLARQHAQGLDFRALVINAGNANAGTGDAGLADARTTCGRVAQLVGCAPEQVLPFSTGVIMEPLPVERVVAGLPVAAITKLSLVDVSPSTVAPLNETSAVSRTSVSRSSAPTGASVATNASIVAMSG